MFFPNEGLGFKLLMQEPTLISWLSKDNTTKYPISLTLHDPNWRLYRYNDDKKQHEQEQTTTRTSATRTTPTTTFVCGVFNVNTCIQIFEDIGEFRSRVNSQHRKLL
jgi:hypothetical protein